MPVSFVGPAMANGNGILLRADGTASIVGLIQNNNINQIDGIGIGDAERVTDRGVRGRSSSLAVDAAVAAKVPWRRRSSMDCKSWELIGLC